MCTDSADFLQSSHFEVTGLTLSSLLIDPTSQIEPPALILSPSSHLISSHLLDFNKSFSPRSCSKSIPENRQTRLTAQIVGNSVSTASWIGIAIPAFLVLVIVSVALSCWIRGLAKGRHTTGEVIVDTDMEVSLERMASFDSSFMQFEDDLGDNTFMNDINDLAIEETSLWTVGMERNWF
jgi:hypothetical protein